MNFNLNYKNTKFNNKTFHNQKLVYKNKQYQ